MNPVTNVVNFSDASSTLQNVTAYATPMFSSTIQPSAFMMGIEVGGILVAFLIGAIYVAISGLFSNRADMNDDYYIKGPGSSQVYHSGWKRGMQRWDVGAHR